MGIRDAFETEVGLVTATTLHTLGAIGVVAALLMFLAHAKRIRSNEPRAALRRATATVIWVSIAANLVGGFMRTYLPGHPTIAELGHSGWVQVMLLKHIFIFASMGALLHLHYMVTPWLEKRVSHGLLDGRVPTAQAVSVFIVILSVVVASVLGGFAQITPLGEGHEGEDGSPPATIIDESDDARVFSASSSLTTIPVDPRIDRGTFQVRNDVVSLDAVFVHDTQTGAELTLTLTDPKGTEFSALTGDTASPPALAGVWRYEVSADVAVDVAWSLDVTMTLPDDNTTALAERVAVAPGAIFEINTQMPLGGTFCWDWTSSVDVTFDVHSHFDGEVQYYLERSSDGEYDCFTNDREGGYSLLWANEGATPTTVDYRVWGDFVVDSYFPPR